MNKSEAMNPKRWSSWPGSGSGEPEFKTYPLGVTCPGIKKPDLPGAWERQGVHVPRGQGALRDLDTTVIQKKPVAMDKLMIVSHSNF